MKYAFSGREDGEIYIGVTRNGDRISLVFADNGRGIPEAVTVENSSGFGLQLVGMLVSQIGGKISTERINGTRYRIAFSA